MKILRHSSRETVEGLSLGFDRLPYDGGGYAFEFRSRHEINFREHPSGRYRLPMIDGDVIIDNPIAMQSYVYCTTHPDEFGPHIDLIVRSYIVDAIGECDTCGRTVTLYGFTNTCECGADYNQSGQHLAPRSQWGEETGESLADILSIR